MILATLCSTACRVRYRRAELISSVSIQLRTELQYGILYAYSGISSKLIPETMIFVTVQMWLFETSALLSCLSKPLLKRCCGCRE